MNGVNIYGLMQSFWRENEYEPFSTAAIALYFFLVNRANNRRWKMPFMCQTSSICISINVTRQTVINARESLCERNLITYTKGVGKGAHPMYSLVLTDNLTDNLTDTLQDSLRDDLRDRLTPYNKEDKNIKDKNYSLNKTDDLKFLNLEELEALLVSDESWLNEISFLLSPSSQCDISDLKIYLGVFFSYLRCQGMKVREENDCRKHFVNWLNKQLNSKSSGTKQPPLETRRPSGVAAKSASEYEGAF